MKFYRVIRFLGKEVNDHLFQSFLCLGYQISKSSHEHKSYESILEVNNNYISVEVIKSQMSCHLRVLVRKKVLVERLIDVKF